MPAFPPPQLTVHLDTACRYEVANADGTPTVTVWRPAAVGLSRNGDDPTVAYLAVTDDALATAAASRLPAQSTPAPAALTMLPAVELAPDLFSDDEAVLLLQHGDADPVGVVIPRGILPDGVEQILLVPYVGGDPASRDPKALLQRVVETASRNIGFADGRDPAGHDHLFGSSSTGVSFSGQLTGR